MMNEVNHNSGRRPGSGGAGAPEPELPGTLIADLRTLYRPPASAPPEVDRAILAAARETLAARRRQRLIAAPRWSAGTWRWATASTIAAALILGAVLWSGNDVVPPVRMPGRSNTADPGDLPGDLDRNGRVDIADAFLLARALERGAPPEPHWDVDRDGAVGPADVRRIAQVAVDLSRRREP